ncbi:contact-dependent growth inhibition system immunity protein [Allokutzneria albata]|uniref:Uncharacterized protein n=1 Tax=Allokutzneria albata TaxID=211114 RepID=A0A1G9UAS0_ALLAB|nr:contact-dependent growth inhibition system immunity protein [Allokutzneria albata]SDM56814.1 hypothetical protein SAMN04489726_2294 [Allokutzneria albata]
MGASEDDPLIRELFGAFLVAVRRQVPRELAALMCEDEAQSFLDTVANPDDDVPAEPVEEPIVRVVGVRVFGDVALARFTQEDDEIRTLHFRRENGRWTVCADAEDDMSLDQLEDDAPSAGHPLRRTPVGRLGAEDLRVLLERGEGLDILLPRVVFRLRWEPLLRGAAFPGDVLLTVLGVDSERWVKDPVALVQMNSVVEAVHRLGNLADHGAPHDVIRGAITEFLARQNLRLSDLVEDRVAPPVAEVEPVQPMEVKRAIVVPTPAGPT